MTKLVEGFHIQSWRIDRCIAEAAGYRDFNVTHEFLACQAEARVFGPEFLDSPDARRSLEVFLYSLAKTPHPNVRSVLDVGDLSDLHEASLYVILEPRAAPSLFDRARQSPLDSRDSILPFLQTLAALLVDFQGIRLAPDRLTLKDFRWEDRSLTIQEFAWPLLLEGSLQRKLPELVIAWEKAFEGGIYPLGHKTFPRTEALACIGRLAYETAGIPTPEKRLQQAPDDTAAPAPLVPGWGFEVEALVRRCLFAHRPGMMDSAETLLRDVELLMAGQVPSEYRAFPVAAREVKVSAPTRQIPAIVPHEETADAEATQAEPMAPQRPATRSFTPLGAEAAEFDMSTKVVRKKKKSAPVAPAQQAAEAPQAPVAAAKSALTSLPWQTITIAAGFVLVIAVVVVFILTRGEKPNLPPVVALADMPARVKLLEPVALDASATTDPENDSLTFSWSVQGLLDTDYRLEPNNSRGAAKTTVRFFKVGTHPIILQVFDGRQYSQPTRFEIEVVENN